MGEYNAVNEPGFNRLLSSRMNSESSAPAGTLAPEIIPTFEVSADPLARPEDCYGRGEKLCAAGGEALGGVTQPFFQLTNPLGSGVLCTVEGLRVSTNAGDVLFLSLAFGGASGTGIAETSRDTRWGKRTTLRGRPICPVTIGTAGPFAVNDLLAQLIATNLDLRAEYNSPIILMPGSLLQLQAETAGVDFTSFDIRWRERPLLPSELD